MPFYEQGYAPDTDLLGRLFNSERSRLKDSLNYLKIPTELSEEPGSVAYDPNKRLLQIYASKDDTLEFSAICEQSYSGVPEFGLENINSGLAHDGVFTYNLNLSRFTCTGKIPVGGLAWYQYSSTLGFLRPVLYRYDAGSGRIFPIGGTCGTFDCNSAIGSLNLHILPEPFVMYPGEYYIGLQGVNENLGAYTGHKSMDYPQVFSTDWIYVNWNINTVPGVLIRGNTGTGAGKVNRNTIRPWVIAVNQKDVLGGQWDAVIEP